MLRLPARLSVLAATLFMMPLMARASKAAAATCTKGRPCSAFATSTFGRSPSFFGRAGEGSVGASAARPFITNAFPTLSSHPWTTTKNTNIKMFATSPADDGASSTAEKAGEMYKGAKDKAGDLWEATKDSATDAKEAIVDAAQAGKDKVKNAGGATKDMLTNAKDAVVDTAESGKHKAQDGYESVKDKIGAGADSAQDSAEGLGDKISANAKDAKAKTGTAFDNAKDAVQDGVKSSKDYVNAKADQAGKDGEAIKDRAVAAKDDFNKSGK